MNFSLKAFSSVFTTPCLQFHSFMCSWRAAPGDRKLTGAVLCEGHPYSGVVYSFMQTPERFHHPLDLSCDISRSCLTFRRSVRKPVHFLAAALLKSAGVRADAGSIPRCRKGVISKPAAGYDLLACRCVSVKVYSSTTSSSRHGRRRRAWKSLRQKQLSRLLPTNTMSHGHAVTNPPLSSTGKVSWHRFHGCHPTSAQPHDFLSLALLQWQHSRWFTSIQYSLIPTIDFLGFFLFIYLFDFAQHRST